MPLAKEASKTSNVDFNLLASAKSAWPYDAEQRAGEGPEIMSVARPRTLSGSVSYLEHGLPPGDSLVVRPTVMRALGFGLIILSWVVALGARLARADDPGGASVFAMTCTVCGGFAGWYLGLRNALEVNARELVVASAFRRTVIPLDRLTLADAPGTGLVVGTDRWLVSVPAVQVSGWERFRSKPSRAQRFGSALMKLPAVGSHPDSGAEPTREWVFPWQQLSALLAAALLVAWLPLPY